MIDVERLVPSGVFINYANAMRLGKRMDELVKYMI